MSLSARGGGGASPLLLPCGEVALIEVVLLAVGVQVDGALDAGVHEADVDVTVDVTDGVDDGLLIV